MTDHVLISPAFIAMIALAGMTLGAVALSEPTISASVVHKDPCMVLNIDGGISVEGESARMTTEDAGRKCFRENVKKDTYCCV